MTPSQKYLNKLGIKGSDIIEETETNNKSETLENSRRSFLKKSTLGGIALGSAFAFSPIEELVANTTQKVSRFSAPSDLKITDLRYATTTVLGRTSIIRIDTNQGIYGLGEVRDGADERYALMLKSRLLGQNPCNVEQIFKSIRQFGGQSRQAGGVCGVEMALWDIVGKAYNVPCWQLLGGGDGPSRRMIKINGIDCIRYHNLDATVTCWTYTDRIECAQSHVKLVSHCAL